MAFADWIFSNMEAIIMSSRMEHNAQHGYAAHYIYKCIPEMVEIFLGIVHNIGMTESGIFSPRDTGDFRKIKILIEDKKEPLERVMPRDAPVGEVLLMAGIKLSKNLGLEPKVSLFAPIDDKVEFRVKTTSNGGPLSNSFWDQLALRCTTEQGREICRDEKRKNRK
jgi:hypothetical protein